MNPADKNEKKIVRGMKDLFYSDVEDFEFIIKNAKEISLIYGFFECITPIVEFSSIFERNLGETSDVIKKEIYKFEDRGGDLLALRPEFTAGVVRAFLENNLKMNEAKTSKRETCRIFSWGPLFRYDRPQKGRYRQFNQINFESFLRDGYLEDAEIISLAYNLLIRLGLAGKFTLEINNLGSSSTLLKYETALKEYFESFKDSLSQISRERLLKKPAKILDSKEKEDTEICKNAPKISSFYTPDEAKNFENTLKLLVENKIPFKVNESIVRGLDYYTGIVFEFTTDLLGSQSTILGGGRYNSLVQNMGGESIPAIGFAAGIERLILLIDNPKKDKNALFIVPLKEENISYAFKLSNIFKNQGITCLISSSFNQSLGARLEKISKENYESFALVLGKNEQTSEVFKIKNLSTFEEKTGDINFIISCLK